MRIVVDCKHWGACGVNDGGCCRLNLFGGKPSYAICAEECPTRESTGVENNFRVRGTDALFESKKGCSSCNSNELKDEPNQ